MRIPRIKAARNGDTIFNALGTDISDESGGCSALINHTACQQYCRQSGTEHQQYTGLPEYCDNVVNSPEIKAAIAEKMTRMIKPIRL